MSDADVGRFVLHWFADHGRSPTLEELAAVVGDRQDVLAVLRRLEAEHVIVLVESGESIRMALPFSGIPTDFLVTSGDRSWYANCAWDALAIPTALHTDATIHTSWYGTREKLVLEVAGGEVTPGDGYVGFAVPARHWWDDIVFT